MRRSKRKRVQPNISLFPFLAVLICTLGVLILMLVLATHAADDRARNRQAQQDQQQAEQVDQLQAAIDLHQIRFEGLQKARPDAKGRLEVSRQNRVELSVQIRELEAKLNAAKLDYETARRSAEQDLSADLADSFDSDQADVELEQLRQELELAQAKLAEKKVAMQDSGPNEYVIVPYRGGGGTFRRPIFIECTADGLTLQPAGISIKASDFLLPMQPGNPLDAALLAVREYWQRYDLAGNEGTPYPLLVVRPDGAESFVVARRAMMSWDDEFGYELVEAEKSLEFGQPDEQLNQEIRRAIAESKARQISLVRWQQRQLGAGPGGLQARTQAGMNQVRRMARQGQSGSSDPNATNANQWSPEASGDQRSQEAPTTELDQRLQRIASGETLRGSGADAQPNADTGLTANQASDRFNTMAENQPMSGNSATSGNQPMSGSQGMSGNQPMSGSQGMSGNQPSNSNAQLSQKQTPAGGQHNLSVGNPHADLSLAKQRGANWALPTQTPGATGYLRPIRIHCLEQEIQLTTASGQRRRIPFTGPTATAVPALVDEIWKLIDSWGVAGAGSYWKPELRVTVKPGGRGRFEELQGVLLNSGLVIKGAQE